MDCRSKLETRQKVDKTKTEARQTQVGRKTKGRLKQDIETNGRQMEQYKNKT